MTDEWYYAKNRQRVGPVTLGQLRQLLGSGELQATDMVLPHGSQQWLPASSVSRVDGAGSLPPPARGKTSPDSPGSSSVNGVAATVNQRDGEGTGKQRLAVVGIGAPASVPAPPQGISLFTTLGRFFLREIKETRLAVWQQSTSLLRYVKGRWRKWSLCRDASVAKIALGQRLHGAGVGDGQLRSQIATLEATIRTAEAEKRSTKALETERDRLFIQLAGATLTGKSPPAGGDAEYRKARESQVALDKHTGEMAAARRDLFPRGGTEWRRLILGYGALVGVVLLPLVLLRGQTGAEAQARNESKEKAVADDQQGSANPSKGSLTDSQPSGTAVVFAEGIGTTQDEALKDAFRTAVQRVVGVFVDSETLVKNDAIISDKVLTFSDGAIKKYEELDRNESNGIFRIRIKAAVERREVAARLEAAHISVRTVELNNVVESFSKEVQADLDRLAHEATEKEAKENALAILQKDLSRIAKLNMIEAKVVGEPERGVKSGDKLPVKIKVRYEINKEAYQAAMSKLEKSLLMNSLASGKITVLATPELLIKKGNQSSIKEDIGYNEVILVNTGLASENWRSHWNYYIVPKPVGELYLKVLCNKLSPRLRLSLLDKDGQDIAIDEFSPDKRVTAFRSFRFGWLPVDVALRAYGSSTEDRWEKQWSQDPSAKEWFMKIFPEGVPLNPDKIPPFPQQLFNNSDSPPRYSNNFRNVVRKHVVYTTAPFTNSCNFASPLFFDFSYGKEIQYMMTVEEVRSISLLLVEVKLIQSVKCEVY